MSILNRLTGKDKEIPNQWIALNDIQQLDEIVEKSKTKPVVIFKHSTTCGISYMSKSKLESAWDFTDSDLDFYYLDLLTYRPISNEVARKFNIVHQSPQVILIKDGEATFDTSHHAISVNAIRNSL